MPWPAEVGWPWRPASGRAGWLMLGLALAMPLAGAGEPASAPAPAPVAAALPALPPGMAPVRFGRGQVVLSRTDGSRHRLPVEIAETPAQRERGLMYRHSLPADQGMLFIYSATQRQSFWMLNTWLPLSIAFADRDGVIRQILAMAPCARPDGPDCRQVKYTPRVPYRYALEVNQGYFTAHGIGPGDRLELVRD